jgi:hypothetical protein
MNAWMHTAIWTGGMILASGMSAVGTGCSSGGYTLSVQVTPLGVWVELTFSPLGHSQQYDLDGIPYQLIEFEGKWYRFYPSKGWLYDPETGQLYQLDDPSWERLLRSLKTSNHEEVFHVESHSRQETRTTTCVLFPSLDVAMGIPDARMYVSVHLQGDTPLPNWDVERWTTLERKLFVFPDGEVGSPDPMRLELSGEASDVVGYLAQLGVNRSGATVDGRNWTLVVDAENEWADIYLDESLVTSIPLN